MQEDIRIDRYIEKAEEFAQPVLNHLREMVHAVCPEVTETMKWSFPHFMYKGSILCSMASFKHHCAFGFWLGSFMEDTHGLFKMAENEKAMGQWGKIKSISDLPGDEILAAYILQAIQLTDDGLKLPKKPVRRKEALTLPDDFALALHKTPAALIVFEQLSPSHRNEYIAWIEDAKMEKTRTKRIEQALLWLSEGKTRDWRYSGNAKKIS